MKIGIVGAGGRMGRMLVREVNATDGAVLAAASERPGNPDLGKDAGELAGCGHLGVEIKANTSALFEAASAIIDFSAPESTVQNARLARSMGKALVIGTTGLSPAQLKDIAEAATAAPVVHAPNMSVGVNLLFALTEKVAGILGTDYDIEIVEMHHRHKVDAPSGTALGLGRAAAQGRGVALDQVWRKARDGHTGARPRGEIGFATLRGGDVVGDHTVIFAADGERIELTHKASSREVFAKGAVRAALWTAGKAPGLYSMRDVLGI